MCTRHGCQLIHTIDTFGVKYSKPFLKYEGCVYPLQIQGISHQPNIIDGILNIALSSGMQAEVRCRTKVLGDLLEDLVVAGVCI